MKDTESGKEPLEDIQEEEMSKPPVFRSWSVIYLLVMAFFVIMVFLFHWFTQAYS